MEYCKIQTYLLEKKRDGCMIHLGIVNKELVVKKVELNVNSGWKVVYKI